jgi:hypothetical protein
VLAHHVPAHLTTSVCGGAQLRRDGTCA